MKEKSCFIVPSYDGQCRRTAVDSQKVPPAQLDASWMKPMLKGVSEISRGTTGHLHELALDTRRFLRGYQFIQAAVNEWTYGELFGYRTGLVPRMIRERFRIYRISAEEIIVKRKGISESFAKPVPGEPAWFWDARIPDTLYPNPLPKPENKSPPESGEAGLFTEVKLFLEQYKESRFVNWSRPHTLRSDSVGFYREIDKGTDSERVIYYILPQGWKELCRRCARDPGQVSNEFNRLGILRADNYGKMQRIVKLPQMGVRRVYEINASLLFSKNNCSETIPTDRTTTPQKPS